MSATPASPPRLSRTAAPHWAAAAQGELRMPYSPSADRVFYPPTRFGPGSLADDVDWKTVSGRGRITGWCVFHRAYFPAFDLPLPYTVVLVRLDAGPQLFGNLVEGERDPSIGAVVEPVFVPVAPDQGIVRFRIVEEPA